MTAIEKIIASIEKLHGADREQAAKHRSYNDWLASQPNYSLLKIIPAKPFRERSDDIR